MLRPERLLSFIIFLGLTGRRRRFVRRRSRGGEALSGGRRISGRRSCCREIGFKPLPSVWLEAVEIISTASI
jgi:hypothetical protein